MILPDCMMPDGADPCRGYHELRAEIERLTAALACYANEANWKLNARFDPNSSWFDGTAFAARALETKP